MNFNAAFEMLNDKINTWLESIVVMLPNFVLAALVMILFFIIAKIIRKTSNKIFVQVSHNLAINKLIASVLFVITITIGFFVSLGILQLDKTVTSLLAGAGIIGLALSLAFQDTFTNFISGVVIATRQPFRIGDVIKSTDHYGVIAKIDMRAITIHTPQGQAITIPNKSVLQNPIINYTEFGVRRVDLKVGVSYGEDLKRIHSITIEAVSTIDYLLKDKDIELFFSEFDDSSINFKVRYWINFNRERDYKKAVSDGIFAIKEAYNREGITIPFPIRTLDFGIKGGQKLNEMIRQ